MDRLAELLARYHVDLDDPEPFAALDNADLQSVMADLLDLCREHESDDDPDPEDEQTPEGQAARRKAITALGRTWARLGFEHFRDGVHVLDLGLVTFEEKLRGLHKNAQHLRSRDGS